MKALIISAALVAATLPATAEANVFDMNALKADLRAELVREVSQVTNALSESVKSGAKQLFLGQGEELRASNTEVEAAIEVAQDEPAIDQAVN